MADSTNWIQTAETIKQLQAEWKTIGPVSRGREKAIWDRFRTACDKFFTRRNADLAQRKGVWADNLARKDALCVRAEALAESTEWDTAAAEIKQLQAEWKTIGPVKKSRSEAIWQRFRAACDTFFQRYAQRHDTARAERVAAREAVCAEVEAIAAAPEGSDAPADLLATARALRALLEDAPRLHQALAEKAGVTQLIERRGVLHIYPSRANFEAEANAWRIRRMMGVQWEELNADALHQREPDLHARYQFGIAVDEAGSCRDPGAYVAALVAHAQARGAQLVRDQANGFRIEGGRLKAVTTGGGDIPCDAAVIAAVLGQQRRCPDCSTLQVVDRLDPDGRLRVQARAGYWDVMLTARQETRAEKITAPDGELQKHRLAVTSGRC